MEFIIDVSQNNDVHTEQSLKMLQGLGLVGGIIRLGDGYDRDKRCDYFADLFRKLGIPFGDYFVPYAGNDMNKELDTRARIREDFPDSKSSFTDAEWYRYADKTIVPPDILATYFWQFYLASNASGFYTARWAVEGYFPRVANWLVEEQNDTGRLGWFANYMKYYPSFWYYITGLGGSLDEQDNMLISIDHLPKILEIIATGKPDLPDPALDWAIWQCITYLPFKELTYWQRHLDYNLIKPEYLEKWFGVGQVPVEPPDYQKQSMYYRHSSRGVTVHPV